jgi:hypothetical protein
MFSLGLEANVNVIVEKSCEIDNTHCDIYFMLVWSKYDITSDPGQIIFDKIFLYLNVLCTEDISLLFCFVELYKRHIQCC